LLTWLWWHWSAATTATSQKKSSFEQNSTINHYFCFPSLKAWLTWGTQQHSRMLACWFIYWQSKVCLNIELDDQPHHHIWNNVGTHLTWPMTIALQNIKMNYYFFFLTHKNAQSETNDFVPQLFSIYSCFWLEQASTKCTNHTHFPELETWQKMMKINCKNSKIPQSFGTLPPLAGAHPPLQPRHRLTPLCLFGPWRGENFPWLNTIVKRNKQLTLSRVDELFTCFTQLWVDWEVKRVFSLTKQKNT
jgi:hypothetical protein